MPSVSELLIKSIRSAAVYNSDVQEAPACILWPDKDRQWECCLKGLKAEVPELFELGDFAPENKCGPAIWLRSVLAGLGDEFPANENAPIIYLPGFSRQDLRAIESCPEELKPLAELQYRGTIWSQLNAKDWTILAFIKSDQGGLGLDVDKDNDCKGAMQLALSRFLKEELSYLKDKHLDKDYFNTLLTGGDPIRDFLLWLDQGEDYRKQCEETAWLGFVAVCKSQLAFDPDKEGLIAASIKLAERHGPWQSIWQRFCEAPNRYPNIPERIKSCTPTYDLFADVSSAAGWPQWNQDQELDLRRELSSFDELTDAEARKKIKALERIHADRRDLVWAELGEAPLAEALEHLSLLAEITSNSLAVGDIANIEEGYLQWGWKADNAMLEALDAITSQDDFQAVTEVIRVIYTPWLEASARFLQAEVYKHGYPGLNHKDEPSIQYKNGDCVLFVDGLRMDTAKRLKASLTQCEVSETAVWSGLPSVTATGKPKVSPAREYGSGALDNPGFEPIVTQTGQALNDYHIKRILKQEGWQVLEGNDSGDSKGRAWISVGDIDHEGHDRGWKLSKHVNVILREIKERIDNLFAAGWESVHVVTDHGWLLLPGGLPKTELPKALSDSKWGRCATIKPGAHTEEHLFSWYWNKDQTYALANGVSCYKKGLEYTHGGLSLQECLNLRLCVTKKSGSSAKVELTDIKWIGLRCKLACEGDLVGLNVDIRMSAGDPSSSIVISLKPVRENTLTSLIVEDEELEGQDAYIVLVDDSGQLVAQVSTIVGG